MLYRTKYVGFLKDLGLFKEPDLCRNISQDKVSGVVERTWPLQDISHEQSIWACLKNLTFAGIKYLWLFKEPDLCRNISQDKVSGLFKEPDLCRDISQDKVSGVVKRTWDFSVQDSPKILPLDLISKKKKPKSGFEVQLLTLIPRECFSWRCRSSLVTQIVKLFQF